MTSSREQTSQKKEASLDSDFFVHFIGKTEDSPADSNKTYIFQLFYCFKISENYHFHLIFKSPFRNRWLPFYRCRNWVKESKLFTVSKQETNRAGGGEGALQLLSSNSKSHIVLPEPHISFPRQQRGACPLVKTNH